MMIKEKENTDFEMAEIELKYDKELLGRIQALSVLIAFAPLDAELNIKKGVDVMTIPYNDFLIMMESALGIERYQIEYYYKNLCGKTVPYKERIKP